MSPLYEWAARWQIPAHAINDLLAMTLPDSNPQPGTEGAIQQNIRLEASRYGNMLWRNNVGAVTTEGNHIRYGLGNDSKKINKHFKSSDLIGITPLIVTPSHVGSRLGIFTSIEVKRGDWKWSGNEREQAQWKWIEVVKNLGGIGCFAKSTEDYTSCITE